KAALAPALHARDRGAKPQPAPRENRLRRVGERRCERADDALVRYLERAASTGAEVRLASIQLVDIELADRRIAVCASAHRDARKGLQLLIAPRDEQGSDALQWDPRPRGIIA